MIKNEKRFLTIFFIVYFALLALTMTVLMITLSPWYFISIGFPALFLLPIFETFHKIPERANRHSFFIVFLIVLRWILFTLAILLPALLWYLIPTIKDSVSVFSLFIPFLEIIVVYGMIIILAFLKGRNQPKPGEKREL